MPRCWAASLSAHGAPNPGQSPHPRAGSAQSISHLNNETAHYTEDANGRVRVRLYLGPVGVAGDIESDHWRFRNLALASDGQGGAQLPDAPFSLSLASDFPQAHLTVEDGVLSFSVAHLLSLIYSHTIVSATLHLYTPHSTGPTGVLVYQNAPTGSLPPPAIERAEPAWNTAPGIAPTSTGIAQSSSLGHWQDWNVTSMVNQWARDELTNTGLTLEAPAGHAPVIVASPLGAGDDGPTSTPYLDITLAPPNAP